MYLKRQEIAGFKSFAGRAKLRFERGVVAVVGPNGSGKSNIADSVRWVLGEQSAKLLRLKKHEEVIFNGTDSKPRASMAEVSLLLDNSDEKMPLDFREVEITRRLYRSGESEYLLNGNKVRLIDIEDILARSGFGQHSYSVIGQGMIDNLILAAPAERKLLFDEASGIRIFELRREASLKKLEKTKLDLIRTGDIIKELEPKAKLLSEQAALLNKREEFEADLKLARQNYISSGMQRLDQAMTREKHQQAELSKAIKLVASKLEQIHTSQAEAKKTQLSRSKQFAGLTRQLKKVEHNRDARFNQLVVAQAELNVLKGASAGQADRQQDIKLLQGQLAAEEKSLSSHKRRHAMIGQAVERLESSIKSFDDRIAGLTSELNSVRNQLNKGQKKEYLQHALGLIQMLSRHQRQPSLTPKQVDLTLHKLARLLRLAADDKADELTAQIGRLQNLITKVLARREDVAEELTNEILKQRSIELDMGAAETAIEQLRDRQQEISKSGSEDEEVTVEIEARHRSINQLQGEVDQLDAEITALRDDIYQDNEATTVSSTANLEQSREAEQLSHKQASLQANLDLSISEMKAADHERSELIGRAKSWFGGNFAFGHLLTAARPASLDEIARLEAEIDLLGTLDPGLVEQAGAEQSRLQFLTDQQADLERATADLEQIIRGLEGMIAEKFEQAFTKINRKFNDYFISLFGGGRASLKLKKDSLGQYGIEIKASPPGKKVELLTSLSGGERALAAVALLAAILSVNPSPFVILDEVDAALDDTNSLKFARILRELAKKTQVIVITHNHETMKIADQLFGVTTDKSGDSILFSAKLTEARELAEA